MHALKTYLHAAIEPDLRMPEAQVVGPTEANGRVIPSIACRDDLALRVGRRFVELPRRTMPSVAQAKTGLVAAILQPVTE